MTKGIQKESSGHALADLFPRFGLPLLSLIITVLSISSSVIITVSILLITKSPIESITIIISIIAPLLITPVIVIFYAKLLRKIAAMEDKMRKLAIYDSLTGLSSRFALIDAATKFVDFAIRNNQPICALYCDLDRFKAVNDTYGHEAGDLVLKEVSEALRSSIRSCDLIGRLGGEEILLMLPETNIDGALHLAEKLRKVVETLSIAYNGQDIKITMSIGVCPLVQPDMNNLDKMIAAADKALYRSKQSGRNRTTVYSAELLNIQKK